MALLAHGGVERAPSGAAPVALAASSLDDTEAALDEIEAALAHCAAALVLVFHSPRHAAPAVAESVARRFPGCATAGCTTAGELSPDGFSSGGMVALAIGGTARAAVSLVPNLAELAVERMARIVGTLAASADISPTQLRPDRQVFITLTDGLVGGGERLLAALADAAPGIPVVGGSAGDGDRLHQTWVWADGVAACEAAAILLLDPGLPFRTFAVHHFEATAQRSVVTGASAGLHRIHELDGRPAAGRLAELLQIPLVELARPRLQTLALERQLGFLVGGQLHMRGLLGLDGSDLILAGAVEEGMVLRVGLAGDVVETTRRRLREVLAQLGSPPRVILGFNCVGRLIQCPPSRLKDLHGALEGVPLVGFSTLGEQFGPLQVNYTLAGLVLGTGVTLG